MRIFIYEYTCGLPSLAGMPDSLQAEGRAMLAAVVADAAKIPGVEVSTILGQSTALIPNSRCHRAADPSKSAQAFRDAAALADWSMVIAPEFDDTLVELSATVLEVGGRLLGSTVDAIRLTADKLALSTWLKRAGIATVETLPLEQDQDSPLANYPQVWKPRFGAGSLATFLVRAPHDWPACRAEARGEQPVGSMIVQPYVPGQSVSVAAIVGPGGICMLEPSTQQLTIDGRFRYLGGRLPIDPRLGERARRLTHGAVRAVPGLCGYVGVDLILGDPAEGDQDIVMEINPRLTTSYVGLRALARSNLVEFMLGVVQGHSVSEPVWKNGQVEFNSMGEVEFRPSTGD